MKKNKDILKFIIAYMIESFINKVLLTCYDFTENNHI